MPLQTYKLKWPEAMMRDEGAQLTVELYCFRVDHPPEKGGLGRYYHLRNVCKIIWPKLEWHPWMEWGMESLCDNRTNAWTGCAAASKTFMTAVFAMVFWLADPLHTSVVLCTTTGKMVRKRSWPIIQQLYRDAVVDLPGNMVDSKTTLQGQKGDDKNGIFGIAVKDGPVDKAVGNIKGVHNKRMFFIIDEATDTPEAICQALPNLQKGCEDFRICFIGNATSHMDSHGRICEPREGWKSITVDDEEWEIKGVPEWGMDEGMCLHFDGEKSPNIVNGEDKWKFIYTNRDLARAQSFPEARNTVPYWRETRGFWTPDGIASTIFTESLIDKHDGRGSMVFLNKTTPIASLDPALGGDRCRLRFGLLGNLPDGRSGVLLTKAFNLPIIASAEPKTYQIVRQVMEHCKREHVDPENFALDSSGMGSTIADVFCNEWSSKINRVDFGGAASDLQASAEDEKKACEKYDRRVTELWFSCRQFLMGDQLRGLDVDEVIEFCSREYHDESKKIRLDTKKECKKKIGRSPDCADSVAVMVALAREKGAIAGKRIETDSKRDWKKLVHSANKVYANVSYAGD